MFGVLVDVSGSMQRAYAVDYGSSVDKLNVERTHAILTTVLNIVKRETIHHEQEDSESIFVSAFGLREPAVTCDLISLLEFIAGPADSPGEDGYQALIDLAKQRGASQAEPWIRGHLSQLEARILYEGLRFDQSLIPKLIDLFPSTITGMVKFKAASFFTGEAATVRRTEAYRFAHEIIEKTLQRNQRPKPRPVQRVAEMLDGLLSKGSPSARASAPSSSESFHDRIQKCIEPIKPYIYGGTPMCEALKDAESVFLDHAREFGADSETTAKSKVLFILSDGMAADGDPRPIANRLRSLSVTIVTCYLTSDHIDNPRRLFDIEPNWQSQQGWVWLFSLLFAEPDGRSVLFNMSSTMRNTEAPISHLAHENWVLPPSGESRLFIQANSLDVVNEFCKIAVSQMTETLRY